MELLVTRIYYPKPTYSDVELKEREKIRLKIYFLSLQFSIFFIFVL